MEKFQKHDIGKNRLELIDPAFIEGLGRILTFGAQKYEANNWKKGNTEEDRKRIEGAVMRHFMDYMKGNKLDKETGENHLYHLAAEIMFLAFFDREDGVAE